MNLPAGQCWHCDKDVRPAVLSKRPDGQFLHDACAPLGWYLPLAQLTQLAEPTDSAEREPGRQPSQPSVYAPVVALKRPPAQGVHVPALVSEIPVLKWPGEHGLCPLHVGCPSASWYCDTSSHARHVVCPDDGCARPNVHGSHDGSLPADGLKRPEPHAAHCRSAVSVGAETWCSPASHDVIVAQSRSSCDPAARTSY